MLENLRKEKIVAISNISAMSITFLFLGLFISVIVLSQSVIKNLEKQAQVTAFFKDDFTEESIKELQTQFNNDERVESTSYVSKEDAFKIFTDLNKDDPILLESVSASILPASLEIRAKDLDDLPVLAQELNEIDGVEEVTFFKEAIDNFKRVSNTVFFVGLALVIVLGLVSVSVIMVTLKLSIDNRGKELEILKLVGASDEYVKKPLIQKGVLFGIISALLASTIIFTVSLLLQIFQPDAGSLEIYFLATILPQPYSGLAVFSILLSFVLIVVGFGLGYLGSIAAIKKYLKY